MRTNKYSRISLFYSFHELLRQVKRITNLVFITIADRFESASIANLVADSADSSEAKNKAVNVYRGRSESRLSGDPQNTVNLSCARADAL